MINERLAVSTTLDAWYRNPEELFAISTPASAASAASPEVVSAPAARASLPHAGGQDDGS